MKTEKVGFTLPEILIIIAIIIIIIIIIIIKVFILCAASTAKRPISDKI
jgi:competence protein ComGC